MLSGRLNYHDYLQIDQLLNCQKLESEKTGHSPAHDEHLFIVIHQVYELWFKQILFEVDSVRLLFKQESVDEKLMNLIVSRLSRVVEIQKILIDQVTVLETMTPLDFLEFRDLLIPASGFQSFQFRKLETKLGLKKESRLKYNQADFDQSLKTEQRSEMAALEKDLSLFELINRWLERTPFLHIEGFDFWQSYQDAVKKSLLQELSQIELNLKFHPQELEKNRKIVEAQLETFGALFNEERYKSAQSEGVWRFAYKAIHAALLIQLYRDQPAFQLPFRLLTTLQDIDENFTSWRYRHALMAKRMLGSKVGTGGSSGYQYLRESTDQHRIFQDLFQLTTFFIPRSKLPQLPAFVEAEMGFRYTEPKNSGNS